MLIIINGYILTMAGTTYELGYIIINKGKIVEIDEMNNLKSNIDDIEVIDANGNYVMPGLIDAHCHLGLIEDAVGVEGKDANEKVDPLTPHLRVIDGIYYLDKAFEQARESGITSVVVCPGSTNVIGGQCTAIKTYGKTLDEMIIKDPVAIKVALGENPKRIYGNINRAPFTRMGIAGLIRESLIKARIYKINLENHTTKHNGHATFSYDIRMDALLKVLNKEIHLKVHVHRADDILTIIRIAKEFDVNITLDHCTEGYLIKDILRQERIPIITGPLLTPADKLELKNQSLKNPGILANEGLDVAIMSDHPSEPIQFLLLSAAMAMKEGMSMEAALKSITITAAKIVGIDDRVGSLEVNKDADIILLDGNPFELSTNVSLCMINGIIVHRHKSFDMYSSI